MSAKQRIYILEANIGAGKTTLIKNLADLAGQVDNLLVFDEPVNRWQTEYVDSEGRNILSLFYEDPSRWSFHFEVAIMTTRYNRLEEALRKASEFDHPVTIVMERCIETDRRCFAENLHETGAMSDLDWRMYLDWHDTFMRATQHVYDRLDVQYIHLHTTSETCFKRMKERGRDEEKAVPLAYLKHLEEKHIAWMTEEIGKSGGLVVGGEQTEEEVFNIVKSYLGY